MPMLTGLVKNILNLPSNIYALTPCFYRIHSITHNWWKS